jgi:hypothetical protein
MRWAQASCCGCPDQKTLMLQNEIMAPALPDGSDCPDDVLIVEDDPIIAIDSRIACSDLA